MQNYHTACQYVQFARAYRFLPIARNFPLRHSRGFANRKPSPAFNAAKPGAAAPKDAKQKAAARGPNTDDRSKQKAKQHQSQATILRKYGIRLTLFSIVAVIGYKIYNWQTNPKRSLILNPRFFTPFILVARDKISSTSSILHLLSVPKGQNTENVSEAWRLGIWSVQVVQPELQIARAYTPLPPKQNAEPEQLRLFVRLEPQGEVSSMLHKIPRGTLVHCRGPHLEYEIPEDVDEVLFLAGGTGIAPALQVAHVLHNYRTPPSGDGPKLHILWANRRREDSYLVRDQASAKQSSADMIPKLQNPADLKNEKPDESFKLDSSPQQQLQTRLIEEVELLKSKHGGKVTVDYFVDEEGSFITESLLRKYLGRIEQDPQKSTLDSKTRRKIVFISGPEGFIDSFAGPKAWQGGKQIQGPLGGILQKIDLDGWEVWKL